MRSEKMVIKKKSLGNRFRNPLFGLLSVNRLGGTRMLPDVVILPLVPPLPYNSTRLGSQRKQISAGN